MFIFLSQVFACAPQGAPSEEQAANPKALAADLQAKKKDILTCREKYDEYNNLAFDALVDAARKGNVKEVYDASNYVNCGVQQSLNHYAGVAKEGGPGVQMANAEIAAAKKCAAIFEGIRKKTGSKPFCKVPNTEKGRDSGYCSDIATNPSKCQ